MENDIVDKYKIAKKVVLFQLLYHCVLMYDYLTETGKKVPAEIGNDLSVINLSTSKLLLEYNEAQKKQGLSEELEFEYHTKIASVIEKDKEKLTTMFNTLTKLVKPASPCTLENTIMTDKIFIHWGHRCTRFIRTLWWYSLFFLLGYVIFGSISASGYGLLESKDEGNKLFAQLLLFFSAGLGACLYAITTSKRYLLNRTFDDNYISHYFNRIVLGIITGFILANLINASFFPQNNTGIIARITPSMLALLGGFSADAVIRILNRLVAMITTLVEGETKDIIDSNEQKIKINLEASRIRQNMDYAIKLKTELDASGLNKNSTEYKNIENVINKLIEDTD